MPGFAQRTATPPFPLCLSDGNSNVIEISARAKSHLQRETERKRERMQWNLLLLLLLASLLFRLCRPHASPTIVPCLVLISALLKTAALLFLLLYFFPISSPSSPLSLSFCPDSVVVTFWQISEIYVCMYIFIDMCVCMRIASIFPIFPDRGSQLVTLCLCHMPYGSVRNTASSAF